MNYDDEMLDTSVDNVVDTDEVSADDVTGSVDERGKELTDSEKVSGTAEDKGETTIDRDEKSKKGKRAVALVNGVAAGVALLAYLALGMTFVDGNVGFERAWPIFLLVPVASSIAKVKYSKKVADFNYFALALTAFCTASLFTGYWHQLWVLLLTAPIYSFVAKGIDSLRDRAKEKKSADGIAENSEKQKG